MEVIRRELGIRELRPEEFIHDAAVHALSATATKEDLPTLRKAFSSPLQATRVAAILAAGVVLGDRAPAELEPLMRDGSEATRYAAARALANRGVRASLPVLGELLSSDHGSTRLRAVQTLRLVRGKPFGYSAHLGAAARRNAERAWLDWISSAGPKASWPTPIRARPLFRGRTLISLYSDDKIIEIDASGRQVWEQKILRPWACVGLPNGHRLVCMYKEKAVVEYDASGNEVWRTKVLPGTPTSVQRLPNGNTLIACSGSGGMAIEVAPDRAIVWERKIAGNPTSVERLPNGNLLVSSYQLGRVVEMSRAGKILWEVKLHRPIPPAGSRTAMSWSRCLPARGRSSRSTGRGARCGAQAGKTSSTPRSVFPTATRWSPSATSSASWTGTVQREIPSWRPF